MIHLSNDVEAAEPQEPINKPDLLVRELQYCLKYDHLPPPTYLRDLIKRSLETIQLLGHTTTGVN